MLATTAVEQIYVMSSCLTSVLLDDGRDEIYRYVPGLEFKKILTEFLKPKLKYNAKLSEKDLESSEVARVDRLVSSLAITHVIALCDVDLAYRELKGILHCLVIRANVSGGCDFDGIRNDFPEEMWSHLVQSILHVMEAASKKRTSRSCPDFILAVPLIHFLRKELKPFEEPEETPVQLTTIEEWCRAEGLIQYKTYDDGFVESFLPEASPMFKVDPLLCRLFLHYTPLEDFPKVSNNLDFPMHEICTALFYRVRNASSTSKLWAIEETLSNLIKRQTTSQERSEQSKTLLFVKTSISLLQELVPKQVKPNDKLFFTGIHFALEALCSAGYDCPENERKTKIEDERQGHVTDDGNLSIILNLVDAAIEKKFYSKFSVSKDSQKSELEVWTALLDLNVSKKSIGDSWIKDLVLLFERRLEEVDDKNVLELFCEVEMDENFHQALVQCITKHAFDAVERIVEKGGSEGAFTALHDQSLRSGDKSKAGELLSRLIARVWSKAMAKKNEITHHDVLRFALMWKPWAGFLSFYGSQEKEKMLTQHANMLLHRVIGCLLEVQGALADGSIKVKPLTLLNQFKENFMCLCLVLSTIQSKSEDNQGWHSIEDVNMNLEKRMEEYRVFQTTKEHLQKFVGICRSTEDVAFDINALQDKANCDTSDLRMADLCKRVPFDDDHAAERIDVVFFDILPSRKLPFILTQILDAYKTKTFQVIWKSTCKAVKDKKADNQLLKGELTLLDVLDKVWPPSIKKWTLLAQSVFDGSIKLKDVDRSFKTIGSEEYLKEELDIMFQQTVKEDPSLMDEIVSERVSQVARYRSLQDYIQSAETVWKFKEALRLSGDFDVIEDLRNQESEEFRDKDLKSIDERFTRAGKYLTVIPLEHSCCLDTVIECEPLVTWLRETIKDTSALSTLVDLAMISAGENDLEVDRISNFHSSCLNFAPLIFNLNASFGFEDLMKTCEPVWKAVIQDKKLPKKLAETCRHLKWLKAVQSSHGSVEMSSIMQVKTINSSGVFQVGQISQDPNEGLSVSGEHKELENVFTLTVPIDPKTRDPRRQQEEEKREELKTYSLNDLKDLQSKLMLIAGKTAQLQNKDGIESTEEIKGFVEVLEGVMRLGQVYIDLCEAGDVKYFNNIDAKTSHF